LPAWPAADRVAGEVRSAKRLPAMLICAMTSLSGAAPAGATTVMLGPPTLTSGGMRICNLPPCPATVVNETVVGGRAAAPAAGTITAWRVLQGGSTSVVYELVVLGNPTGTGYTSRAISGPALDNAGNPNLTSLAVQAGDIIGVTESASATSGVANPSTTGASERYFGPGFTSPGQSQTSSDTIGGFEAQYNADLVLAPQIFSIGPATGPAVGGTEVTISGQSLDGATQVSFGSTPAASVTVDSSTRMRAIAPAGAGGSTVDVTVTGPGGTSATSNATKFTYQPTRQHTLVVANGGTGSGRVTSSPAGIDCGLICSHAYDDGTQVTLTATGAAGSVFAGWTGACSGTGACQLQMSLDRSVSATFIVKPPPKAPNTQISRATISSAKHKATFRFKALGAATGFQCALVSSKHKKPKFKKCRSPTTYSPLKRGTYTFEVRAINVAGRADPSPAKQKFKIR